MVIYLVKMNVIDCDSFEFNQEFDHSNHVPLDKSKKEGFQWIYGIYSTSGECLYIGRTGDFRERRGSHFNNWRSKFNGSDKIMLPIRQVPESIGKETEREMQFCMEKIGQAKMSNQHWRKLRRKHQAKQ